MPVTEAPSRPVPCPTCSPAAVRSPTPRRGSTWPLPGASSTCPRLAGRDGDAIVAAAAAGELGGLVVGGVDPADLPDPALARQAVETAGFVVALEVRDSEVTRAADVVFPVAPVTDRSGTFVNWEGRVRQFGKVLHNPVVAARPAGAGRHRRGARHRSLGFRTSEQVWAEMTQVGPWDGERATLHGGFETVAGAPRPQPPRTVDGSCLASWKQLIDDGRMQDGDDAMRRTARKPVVLVGPATLEALGATVGDDGHADRSARLGRPADRRGRPRRGHRLGAGQRAGRARCGTSSARPAARSRSPPSWEATSESP